MIEIAHTRGRGFPCDDIFFRQSAGQMLQCQDRDREVNALTRLVGFRVTEDTDKSSAQAH
jgi:hypothetical protein